MRLGTVLKRSLVHYRRDHGLVVMGAATATAVLVGALIIGDSVRNSLERLVYDRLGKTEYALVSGDRFFRARLAEDLSGELGAPAAPLLMTRGLAVAGGGRQRRNDVQIVGVDRRFGDLAGGTDLYSALGPEEVVINATLAAALDLSAGEEVLFRIDRLGFLPKDAPLSFDTEAALARRFRVRAVADEKEFGRFNLKADQVTRPSAFLSLETLGREMNLDGRANVLLVGGRDEPPLTVDVLQEAFEAAFDPADVGLELRRLPGDRGVELRSDRIFLDPPTVRAAAALDPSSRPILTYFVNEFSLGRRMTPYSFVSAPGPPLVPVDTADDEILINAWLAEDLGAGEGDTLRLSFFVLGEDRDLDVSESVFRVRAVVPLEGAYADRELLPDFPGLADVDSSRDWDPGIPIDLDLIRDKDEDYWSRYRGTPKAFLNLSAAQRLWANRFGNLTAVRFETRSLAEVKDGLKRALTGREFGLRFHPVKADGLRAGREGVDFAQLFLGLSFFVIAAALLLTGLLYGFSAEKRTAEYGLLLALGYSRKSVRRAGLREGAILVLAGGLLGGVLGMVYDQAVLLALKTVWKGAVGTAALRIHLEARTILTGILLGGLSAFITIFFVVRNQLKKPVTQLQRGMSRLDRFGEGRRPRLSVWIGAASALAAAAILLTADYSKGRDAFGFFFGAGSLLLICGLAFANVWLHRLGRRSGDQRMDIFRIAVRGAGRRRVRSLTLAGLLAAGLFIVFTVGANRRSSLHHADERSSGTGGFALYGETSLPVLYDLNSPAGREAYGLNGVDEKLVDFVQLRVREGEDASCLNLNRVTSPQLIGVDPGELGRRQAFTFVEITDEVDPENPWSALDRILPGGLIPAVADHSVVVWGLGKSVGDTLSYTDENGGEFEVKIVGGLANSIFQGNVIVAEDRLIEKYPSLSGSRLMLVDAPAEDREALTEELSWALQDQGLILVPAFERLAEFNQVENTYLSIFLILGSFGLLLGSLGLGIVVRRNILERRGEMALLRAVGYSERSIRDMVLYEHAVLLAGGVFLGLAAALSATLPSLMIPGAGIPFSTLAAVLVVVLGNGLVWILLAVRSGFRGNILTALRGE